MLTVVIPTLDSERPLVGTLAALIPAAAAGVVSQVVISDGGSSDDTLVIADELGCDIVSAPRGRGPQLAAGASSARHSWLLFLHSDTVLDEGWHREVAHFIERIEAAGEGDRQAAVFGFALDDYGISARFLLLRTVGLSVGLRGRGVNAVAGIDFTVRFPCQHRSLPDNYKHRIDDEAIASGIKSPWSRGRCAGGTTRSPQSRRFRARV